MEVESARDPKYLKEGIFLYVKFKELSEEVPFTAIAGDSFHNIDIYEEALKGSYGEIEGYTPVLEEEKDSKKKEIRQYFISACSNSVSTEKGEFNGGRSSSMAIFDAATLAEYLGEEEVMITDVNNQKISCSIDEARLIALAIGVAYRNLFYKKQNLMVAIDAASSVSEIENITWEAE